MLPDRRRRILSRDEACQRIRSDYFELPGLKLTVVQAARLWGLGVDVATTLLDELVARGFLARWGDQYCRR
jgi:Fic family protein